MKLQDQYERFAYSIGFKSVVDEPVKSYLLKMQKVRLDITETPLPAGLKALSYHLPKADQKKVLASFQESANLAS